MTRQTVASDDLLSCSVERGESKPAIYELPMIFSEYHGQAYHFSIGDFKNIPIAAKLKVDWYNKMIKSVIDFRALSPNWDGYGALEICVGVIADAIRLLSEIIRDDTPEPYIFPTPQGGVQFEWHTEKIDLEIEIVPDSKVIVLYTDPDGTDEEWEQSISADISKLIKCVKYLV